MKLYIEDGEVYLDYSDVDFNDGLSSSRSDYYRYVRDDTNCGWENTLKPQVKRANLNDDPWLNQAENVQWRKYAVELLFSRAKYVDSIEIENASDFQKLIDELDAESDRLWKIENEKRRKLEAEKHWKSLCKNGCKSCSYWRCSGNDFICAVSGDLLDTKEDETYSGKVYQLFRQKPFPTDNCPFNINKIEEAV